jgi:cbb3-type cytochrome oxidase subunit 3
MIEFIADNSPIISLLFFFSVFCYVVYYLLKPGTKKESEKNAKIPLKEDD